MPDALATVVIAIIEHLQEQGYTPQLNKESPASHMHIDIDEKSWFIIHNNSIIIMKIDDNWPADEAKPVHSMQIEYADPQLFDKIDKVLESVC